MSCCIFVSSPLLVCACDCDDHIIHDVIREQAILQMKLNMHRGEKGVGKPIEEFD